MREMRGTQLQKLLDVEAFFMEINMKKKMENTIIIRIIQVYKCK